MGVGGINTIFDVDDLDTTADPDFTGIVGPGDLPEHVNNGGDGFVAELVSLQDDLGNANTIIVFNAAIEVSAHYHTIQVTGASDLDTIDGPAIDGFVLILRRALFSSDITLRDGADNLNLGADFVMDVDNDQIWLVRDGANWNQLARAEAL